MRNKAGLLSIGFIGTGILFAIVILAVQGLSIGLGYLGVSLLGAYMILMNYCRKCPHSMNGTCHHGLPGRIAKRLPYKKTGKYTWLELTLVMTSIGVTFLLPIAYMIGSWLILAVYILLWLVGASLLRVKVCPGCYNRWCVVCPNRVN